jgi:hypothetical protein
MLPPRSAVRLGLLTLTAALALPSGRSIAQARPLRDLIDAEVSSAWQREKITPARPATDAEFLRRVYLDLIGTIPNYEETVAFLDSKDPNKRAQLIDRLLADPRFSQHQADVWDLLLFGRNPPGFDTQKRDGFQIWLRGRFEKNVPYDVWARELLKAEGNSGDGPALFYAQYRNAPEDATESISQTFLGVQLHCARCHDHPYENWTQRDFYGMAAFLARLEVVQVGRKGNDAVYAIGERNSGDVLFTGPAKDAVPGKKGEPVKPKFLHGDALKEPPAPAKETKFVPNQMPPKPEFSRKDQLADWMTRADNPYFARAVANRVWAQYMGRGVVHPVDNLSPTKKPTHPALLDALTKGLVDHKFDLKWYIRELVNSRTYQLSAAGNGDPLPEWFEHARCRPLSAEELADSWRVASGYTATEKPEAAGKGDRFRPLQGAYVIRFFGSPNTGTGEFQGGLHEHLYLNNGPLEQMIGGVKGGLAEFVGDKTKPIDARVDRLFLCALNRRPTDKERAKFAAFLKDGGSATDAVWVLLTCSEFRFNH